MRATVSIYEDPEPKSDADVWVAAGPDRAWSTTTHTYLVLALLAAVSVFAYTAHVSGYGLNATDRPPQEHLIMIGLGLSRTRASSIAAATPASALEKNLV
ncbi:hypothetical protein GGX14DRAFT_573325 [Mycena pura]|uniref:Uncharacterized protein n=1 Tax=Mycena pura TaxID=153505 RepID=A0AAD6UZ28_9AGAR|nr:hypothetical protein GGX14DRAFT_573325 [Mycena pura]